VTAVILGGQTLATVNTHVPLVVGVIIIGVASLLVCFVGYNFLHVYERYAWSVQLSVQPLLDSI
jgi:purine-cytosine permease-like protein